MQLKVKPNQKLTADYMNAIVDRLPKDQAGYAVGGLAMSRSTVQVVNDTGANRDLGDLVVLSAFGGNTDNTFDAIDSIELAATDPAWHTQISALGVLAEPIPNGERGVCVVNGICLVKLAGEIETGHTHVFVDADATTQAKSSYSGAAKILCEVEIGGTSESASLSESASGDFYAIVNLGDSQNLWRYTLKENAQSAGLTSADLRDRRGDIWGTITLRDPLGLMSDQKEGDAGWCINCGNEFEAIQAPC